MFNLRTQVLTGTCVFLLLLCSISSLASSHYYSSDSLKQGPYIDGIHYYIITQDDQQVLALQRNEIDIIGPALLNAYQLESTHAQYIRIIYGPNYLKTIFDAQQSTKLDLFNCMWKDEDGLIMLKPDIHNKGNRDFLRNKYQEYQKQAEVTKEKGKYANVLKYFNNHTEMPQTHNFDSDYVVDLLSRYKYD